MLTKKNSHKYMLSALDSMLQEDKKDQYFIMYDIICMMQKTNKLEVSLYCCYTWMSLYDLTISKTLFPQLKTNNAKYGLSVFHAFAHVMSCQVDYNPQYLKGFGKTGKMALYNGYSSLLRC